MLAASMNVCVRSCLTSLTIAGRKTEKERICATDDDADYDALGAHCTPHRFYFSVKVNANAIACFEYER